MLVVNLRRFRGGHCACVCGSILLILFRNIRSKHNGTRATLVIRYHYRNRALPGFHHSTEQHGIALLLRLMTHSLIQGHCPSGVVPRRTEHFQLFSSCDSCAGLFPQFSLRYSAPSAVTSYLNLLVFSLMLFHPSALGLLESWPPLCELPVVMELISWHRTPLTMS